MNWKLISAIIAFLLVASIVGFLLYENQKAKQAQKELEQFANDINERTEELSKCWSECLEGNRTCSIEEYNTDVDAYNICLEGLDK